MIISLLGYMGVGKSHISKILSTELNFKLVDLDREISNKDQLPIQEIFKKKGEIYFRKLERTLLEDILETKESIVLSLGGGTPVYYDNMELINSKSESFYLHASIPTLHERILLQKDKRPLVAHIADDNLQEFIAKHLFERAPYYNKAHHRIVTDKKNPEHVVQEIIESIYKI